MPEESKPTNTAPLMVLESLEWWLIEEKLRKAGVYYITLGNKHTLVRNIKMEVIHKQPKLKPNEK